MNKILIVLLLVAVRCQAYKKELDEDWRKFKETYNRVYQGHEESKRREAFEINVKRIAKHNREYDLGLHSHRLGLNEYADLSNREFRHLMNGYRTNPQKSQNIFKSDAKNLPDTVDWRDKCIVTGVKNQNQCGSCWAFSVTGTLEGQHAKATGNLVSLSEQNLVDCSQPEGNMGCSGGMADWGYDYIIKNGGIDTEESYPYNSKDGTCKFNPNTIGATMKSYVDLPTGDESSLQSAVANIGPVAIAIDASQFDFQLYQDGVYDNEECSSTLLDHGVLIVGYGTEDGKDYWLVKNSWGASWGQAGYIKMSRNKSNQCGIATDASYPVV